MSEYDEQCAVVQYLELKKLPFFAIPNGGSRHLLEAVKLKKSGAKAGVPDLFVAVARGKYHGLFIEMKIKKGGRVSPEQKAWIDLLLWQGYQAVVCKGFDEAVRAVEQYLTEK